MSDSPKREQSNGEQSRRATSGASRRARHGLADQPGRRPEQAPSYRHAPAAEQQRRALGAKAGRHTDPAQADVRAKKASHAKQVLPAEYLPLGTPGANTDTSQEEPQGRFRKRGGKRVRTHKPNFIARAIGAWWDRLLDIVMEGKVDDQRDMYASHRTTRDYVWNSIGTGAWGMVFPLLTIVCTQLVGAEQAGMFSMAFVTGLLLMFLGNYGVRTYQLSDLNEKHSFSDYQVNRILTCILMMIAGYAYCVLRGYDDTMFLICMGVYSYKMIDALADVYEGRLQQMDKLYLAGISQAFRSIVAIVAFSLFLFLTRNLAVASIAMAIAAAASFVVLTLPLAFLETPKSRRVRLGSIGELFKDCFPLFIALFMYNLIDNMPKFVMEGMLSYDNQLYFNALYFPAHALLLTVQVVYKPQLVRIANVWAQAKRKRFDLIIIAMLLFVLAVTVGLMAIMSTVGIPILGFLYGLDFSEYRGLSLIMVAAGGVTAAIDFLYQIVTVLRKQGSVMKLYLITFGFSLFIPLLLVGFTGLPGAVIGYLIVMSILLVLLVWEYLRIRMQMSRDRKEAANAGAGRTAKNAAPGAGSDAPAAPSDAEDAPEPAGAHAAETPEPKRPRPSEIRAERNRRAEVMQRRTGKHSK